MAHLTTTLQPQYFSATEKTIGWSKAEKENMRWYSAAMMLTRSFEIRNFGATVENVLELKVSALEMSKYEAALGREKRVMSRRANEARSKSLKAKKEMILTAMRNRIVEGQTVSAAGQHTFKIDRPGASAAANDRLWWRHRK